RRDSDGDFLSFQRFPNGERGASLSGVLVRQAKEDDNGTNRCVRDCLAESQTISTSATLGAAQRGFREGSLSGPGACFHHRRVILACHLELGSSPRWSSRVVLPMNLPLLKNQHFATRRHTFPNRSSVRVLET